MSSRTRSTIFFAIAVAWVALAGYSLAQGLWVVGVFDLVAAAVLGFLGYRALSPRTKRGEIKPLRAPRPPR